jgi:hypothetical protein
MSDKPVQIMDFEPPLSDLLHDTCALLRSGNFVVHPLVSKIILHGSRGLAGGYRPASDIDLSLIVEVPDREFTKHLFYEITMTTLDHWQAAIEVDLAVIYDRKKCGLKCFELTSWQPDFCLLGGMDCFGIYKIQKGFHGFITEAGIRIQLIYPCLKIWQRDRKNENQIHFKS